MRHIWSVLPCAALLSLACGEDDLTVINGSVMGESFSGDIQGIAVYRLADTQLSPDFESLDLYFGDGFLSACPDIGEPVDKTTLTLSLRAPILEPGTYAICEVASCVGKELEDFPRGWQLTSGETVFLSAGSVELTSFSSERTAGTFSLEFDGEKVTGEFDLAIECTDNRPPF
jgi:hypothetical protein